MHAASIAIDSHYERRTALPLRLLALLLPALLLAAPTASGVTFTASLDRTSIVLGEQVTLTLSFEGGQPQQISQLPAIDGVQVASGVSQAVNSSLGPNGMNTIHTYSLALEPKRPGEFVIPAFQARAGGESLASQPLTLKVAETDPVSPPPEAARQVAFLWPVLAKRELFAGETLLAEFRLYVRSDIRRISNLQMPLTADGFRFSPMVEGPHYQRRVGGAGFTVIPYSVAITPVKTGDLTVGPIHGSALLNARDPFDFESMFGSARQPQQAALTLDALTFKVLPLPSQNVPPGFAGAVGRFTMTASAGPTNVAVGDPVTVRIRISGEGQFDTLTLPEPAGWDDFKVYPPVGKAETSDRFGTQGWKTFEQVVMPQSTAIQSLPGFSFSYFDPGLKAYRTLTQESIPLTVRPGGSTPPPSFVTSPGGLDLSPPPSRDIVPIKQRPGTVRTPLRPLIQQPWFLALQAAPVLAFIGALAWRKRGESLARNPRLRRQRLVAQLVRDGLNELRSSAAANDSDAFFATVFRLLQEQLGERLDVPASAITEAVIDERLRPRGVSETTLASLHDLFQTCNQARYAPVKSGQTLAAMIPTVENALRRLREVKA